MNIKSVYAALAGLALLCTPVGAQVLVTLSPSPVLQFINANGTPASGGEVFIYAAGTTTKITTYIDSTGATPNTNPIILDTRGDANIWIQPGIAYKYVLAPPGSSDPPTAPIWTVDNISLGSTSVASTTNLQNTARSSVPTGIILRVDYAPGNGAPPMWFLSETGNCASNSHVNDTGSCVDATDGNSWVGSFPNSGADIREFGAIANNSNLNDTPVNSAIAYAISSNTCAFVPGVKLPFAMGATTTFPSNSAVCLVGTPTLSYGGSLTQNMGCQLHYINDTTGIVFSNGDNNSQLRHLSICGNAAESLVATKTYGITMTLSREVLIEDIYIQDFVVDRGFVGPVSRSVFKDVRVNDQTLYPNIVNGFPRSCIEMLSSGGDTAADQFTGDECREQSFGGTPAVYTGDGSTNWFDISIPSGGNPLYRATGINVRVGADTPQQNGHSLINAPLQKCGANSSDGDYTIWDISASGGSGSGGTQLFCTITVASVTASNPQITVPSTTGYQAGANILAITAHGYPIHTTVLSIDNGTQMTLSNPPLMTNAALPIEFTQAYVKNDGCGGTCGTKIEIRFNSGSVPGSAVPITLLWYDPTGDAAIDDEGSSDYVTMRPDHIGGYSVLFYHTQANFGGVDLKPSYLEFINQLADIETSTYGDDLTFHYIVNPALPGAFAGAEGGSIAPWFVQQNAGPVIIRLNNLTYAYNGADPSTNPHPGYISSYWYMPGPPGTQYSSSGVIPAATNTIYCIPLIASAPFQIKSMGVFIVSGGSSDALINMALYANDLTTNRPGDFLTSTGSQAIGTGTGFVSQNATANMNIRSPGAYWACLMGSWTSGPALVSESSANAANPTNLVGSSGAQIGLATANPTTDLFGNQQPVGTSYFQSGLYAAGFPANLIGLTSDISPGSSPLPAIVWAQN